MLTEKQIEKLEKGEYFIKKNLIGRGEYGFVYRINNRYVVKKISLRNFFKKNDYKAMLKEIEATITLSAQNIAPRVVYHSNKNEEHIYYVMEKLDFTLYDLLKHNLWKEQYGKKLLNILNKLSRSEYKHNDLHFQNIMWSNYYNDFRIIDWGLNKKKQKKIKKKNYIR